MRILVTIIAPLVVPVLVYWLYMVLARRKARLSKEGRLPSWQNAPWSIIILSGCALAAASIIYFGHSTAGS